MNSWTQTKTITIVKHNCFQTPPSLPYNLPWIPVPPMMSWCHKHDKILSPILLTLQSLSYYNCHITCTALLCLLRCQRWCNKHYHAPRPLILSNTIVFKHHHTVKKHAHPCITLYHSCISETVYPPYPTASLSMLASSTPSLRSFGVACISWPRNRRREAKFAENISWEGRNALGCFERRYYSSPHKSIGEIYSCNLPNT